MKKFITVAFVLGSFILSTGCSEQTEDMSGRTTPISQITESHQTSAAPNETQTETQSETETKPSGTESTTEQTTTTTVTEPVPETTTATTPAPAAKPLKASAKTCGGKVSLSAIADPESGTITLVVDNQLNEEVRMAGLPTLIDADRFSNDLDPYKNMTVTMSSTAAGSKSKIELSADSSQLIKGFSLKGKLFCMGFFGDTSYTLTFK